MFKKLICILQRQRTPLQEVFQAATLHHTHDQVSALRVAPVIVQRSDVQVLQLCYQLGFGFETADEIWAVGELGQDDLDRHFSVDEGLLGAVDGAMGAFTDAFQQIVSFQAGFSGGGDMTLQFAKMNVRSYSVY